MNILYFIHDENQEEPQKLKFFEVPLSIVFAHHLKLHNSQTRLHLSTIFRRFEIHLKLHNSQTSKKNQKPKSLFEIHLKLHNSQTITVKI